MTLSHKKKRDERKGPSNKCPYERGPYPFGHLFVSAELYISLRDPNRVQEIIELNLKLHPLTSLHHRTL